MQVIIRLKLCETTKCMLWIIDKSYASEGKAFTLPEAQAFRHLGKTRESGLRADFSHSTLDWLVYLGWLSSTKQLQFLLKSWHFLEFLCSRETRPATSSGSLPLWNIVLRSTLHHVPMSLWQKKVHDLQWNAELLWSAVTKSSPRFQLTSMQKYWLQFMMVWQCLHYSACEKVFHWSPPLCSLKTTDNIFVDGEDVSFQSKSVDPS